MTLCSITDSHRSSRKAKRSNLIAEAWKLARHTGLGDLNVSDLAARVGLRKTFLYSYFESNTDLYEAMYADGSHQLLAVVAALPEREDPIEALVELVEAVIRFSTADITRHQLLFHRPVPRFAPSPESRTLSMTFSGLVNDRVVAAGAADQDDIDLFQAILSGLIHCTAANDSVGNQCVPHARRVIEMFLANVDGRHQTDESSSRKAIL